jgi:hypothetical protein
MGESGHPYAQFRRTLECGSLPAILAGAAALDHIELADAVAVCAAVARHEPASFDKFAVRWISRAIHEREHVDLFFIATAVAALEHLRRDGDAEAASRRLGLR